MLSDLALRVVRTNIAFYHYCAGSAVVVLPNGIIIIDCRQYREFSRQWRERQSPGIIRTSTAPRSSSTNWLSQSANRAPRNSTSANTDGRKAMELSTKQGMHGISDDGSQNNGEGELEEPQYGRQKF
jgi:hypothetical protein